MNWSAYVRIWAITAIVLLALTGVINFFVDPYGIFGTREIDGVNVRKPAATTRSRTVKPVRSEQYAAATIVLGNSRPEMGLDPDSPVWGDVQRPVYNLGIPGASLYLMMRYGQNALATGSPKLVLWGLDFSDFLSSTTAVPAQCDLPQREQDWEARLTVDREMRLATGWRLTRARDVAVAGLSVEALFDSMRTLAAQRDFESGTTTSAGFNPARDYLPIMRNEGQYVLFAQKNAEVRARFERPGLRLTPPACETSEDFESVRRLMRNARERGVTVVPFINPYHADYLQAIWDAGLWPLFDAWKRNLVALVTAEGAAKLWDFSLLTPYSTEESPHPGSDAPLAWFWEPSHYKSELGELMLLEMLQPGKVEHPPVGTAVDAATIDGHLAAQRDAAAARWGQDRAR